MTAARWTDLEKLFGERGACGGCWCMTWRLSRSQFEAQKGRLNRRGFRKIVEKSPPGILAYCNDEPVGWCAVAPREQYPVLERSRVLKPIDSQPVWSITCLFVAKPFRRSGMSVALLKAARDYARQQGASIVEGYPVEPYTANMPAVFAWTGLVSAFRKAGFKEVARRSRTRPIMRWVVHEHRGYAFTTFPA
ncbi:MAG: GNAT family N-acetyltransferase [Acidobacteriales bacterium]|nr:GNAT family N-acetyltransferase [Terriglobales bacterium]